MNDFIEGVWEFICLMVRSVWWTLGFVFELVWIFVSFFFIGLLLGVFLGRN